MAVYYFTFILTFILCFIYDYLGSARYVETDKAVRLARKILLFICPIPLIFITIFRYGIGFDYFPTYVSDYKIYQHGGEIHSDFGVGLLYKISQSVSNNPQIFFIITGFLILICNYLAIQRFSKIICFSFLIFVLDGSFFRSLSMVSQYLGIASLLLSFALLNASEVKKSRVLIALVLTVFAISVHLSGIIAGIVIMCVYIFKDKISVGLLMRISACLPLCTLVFKSLIVKLLLPVIEKTRFSSYVNSVFDGRSSMSILIIELFFLMIYFVAIIGHRDSVGKYEVLGLFFESIAVSFALLQSNLPLMDRMAYYFAAFHILTFPRIIQLIKSPILKYITVIAVCCLLGTWLYLYPISGNYDSFQPYMSIFGSQQISY